LLLSRKRKTRTPLDYCHRFVGRQWPSSLRNCRLRVHWRIPPATDSPATLAALRASRRRAFFVALAVFAAGIALLAVVDRKAAYVTLYILGVILLVLGSAPGLGAGVIRPIAGGEADAARAYRHDMHQRVASLSQNLLLLLAGAILIGLAVLLNLA
jgi:hypothetical protein